MDPEWPLESAILKMLCGATAESRAYAHIFLALPSLDRDITVEASLGALEALCAAPAMKLSPVGVQASLRFVATHLSNMHLGLSLDVKFDVRSKLARGALQAFQFFCVLLEKQCGAPKTLKGQEAYQQMFEYALKMRQGGNPLEEELVDKLVLYRWLAPADREAEVQEFVAAVEKELRDSENPKKKQKASAPASSSAGPAESSNSAKQKAKERASAMFA